MWFYFVFLGIIIASLIGLAIVIGSKFSRLVLINPEVIVKEQNLARKHAIMKQRVDRAFLGGANFVLRFIKPIASWIQELFRRQVKKLMIIDHQFRNEKVLTSEQKVELVKKMRGEAAYLVVAEKYGEAEKKYLEALAVDESNTDLYRELSELYASLRRWDRARDAFSSLIKILIKKFCGSSVSEAMGIPMPRFEAFSSKCAASTADHVMIAKQFANLATACWEMEDYSAARLGLESAMAFEPGNPRYLDSLIEACIMEGDQEKAQEILDRLREVNPENAKLDSLQERVSSLRL